MRFLVTLVLGVLMSCAAVAQDLHISLRPHVELAASVATVADIADISGDATRAARIGAVTVLEITQLGEHLIDARAVRTALAPVQWLPLSAISGRCHLSRRALVISAQDLVDAAIKQVVGSETDVKATRVRDDGALVVPDDSVPVNIVAEALDQAASGEIPYRIRVMRGQQELTRSLVVLKVVRMRDMVVAARDLKRGDVLATGDVRIEHMLVLREYAQVPNDATHLFGNVASVDIPTGTPLAPGLFKPACDVHGGQNVTLVYATSSFEVTGLGEAMADGKIGDVILIRRRGDGQMAKGRISAVGTVQMNF